MKLLRRLAFALFALDDRIGAWMDRMEDEYAASRNRVAKESSTGRAAGPMPDE